MNTTAILEQNKSGSFVRRSLSDTPHQLINSDLLRFVEYGKTLVHNTFELWREITGASEVIEKLFAIPTLQEQVESVRHQIQSLRNELSTMKQHDGDRSFIEGRIREKEAELRELQAKKDEEDLFGENFQPVKVVGNVVAEIIPQPESQPREIPQFQVVDTQELARIQNFLDHTAKFTKGRGKSVMFVNVRTGRLDHKSLHHFILKGIPRKFAGLEQILKVEDYETRLKALQQLEAFTRILADGRFNGEVITQFEQITPAMIAEKQTEIQINKHLYQ